jgi:uncharacterized delta-60 repeat protein
MTGIMQVRLSNFALGGGNFIALLGGAGSEQGNSVSLDSTGNIYVCGGAGTVIQLAKYNSLGVIQWQVSLSSSGAKTGKSIKVDASGNVYVAGYWYDGSAWYFTIAKYNSSGTLQWQNKYGYSLVTIGTSVTVDSAGNIIVCGYANSRLEVVKYDSTGAEVWKRKMLAGTSQGLGVAVDSSDNVYVCGTLTLSVAQSYLVKYNSSGTLQWQVSLYDSSGGLTNSAYAVTVDSGNNIYIVGVNEANGAARDFQLSKYNSSGTLQWQKSLSSSVNEVANAVTTDSANNVYVCGYSLASGTFDVQIAKYNSSGTIQWQKSLGGTGVELGYGITVDSANIYICGYSDGLSTDDILIANLPSDGTKTGTYSVGGYSMTYAASSLTDLTSTLTATTGPLADDASTLTTSATTFTAATSTLTSTVTNL